MLGILIILIGLAVTLYFVQRQFIYFPTQQDLPRAELQAKQLGLEPWLREGQFIGWKSHYPNGNATGSVLVLHGNAGAAIHRTYFRNLFQSPMLDARFDVYLLEYPGFGPRPGSPSEASLLQAADEAITQLQQATCALSTLPSVEWKKACWPLDMKPMTFNRLDGKLGSSRVVPTGCQA